MAYDDPNYEVRRESGQITVAGATLEGAKFRHFQAIRLKKVHCAVITAGTATTHGYDVYHGTTSIGTMALSTSTAGSVAHSGLLNELVPTMDQVSVKSLADATGVAHIVYEYEVTNDAARS